MRMTLSNLFVVFVNIECVACGDVWGDDVSIFKESKTISFFSSILL